MLMVAYDDPLIVVVAIANDLSNDSWITVHSAPSASKQHNIITLFWLSSNATQSVAALPLFLV